jgi:hypothetical protein
MGLKVISEYVNGFILKNAEVNLVLTRSDLLEVNLVLLYFSSCFNHLTQENLSAVKRIFR